MTASIGLFGKIPSHPEFISVGMSSPSARAFERWLQMSNDQLARAGVELPKTPVGFCFRDESAQSLLVGVLSGSRDSVGRKFPIAAFHEASPPPSRDASRLNEAFRSPLTQLSMLALTASEVSPDVLKESLSRIQTPADEAMRAGLRQADEALRTVSLAEILSRVFDSPHARAYGIRTLLRACESCAQDGPTRPTAIDARVTCDVELSFWLAAVEARLPASHGPVSAFWFVPDYRVVVVPGVPDSKILVAIASPHSQNSKIWRTETSSEEAQTTAWDKLDDGLREMLEDPGKASIQDFLDRLAETAPSRR